MKEEWKEIEGLDGMMVSSKGRILGKDGLYVKQHDSQLGYKRISVKSKWEWVHRIVAKAFIDNPLGKPMVNHKNGKRDDNRASNLEWVTERENALLASKNGQLAKKDYRHEGVVSVDVVDGTKAFFKNQNDAAKITGINSKSINKCLRGERKTSHGRKWYYLSDYQDMEYVQLEMEGYMQYLAGTWVDPNEE